MRVFLVILSLLVLGQAAFGGEYSLWKAVEVGRAITFRLYKSMEENDFTCTGFRVSPSRVLSDGRILSSYVVTAGHCVLFVGRLYKKHTEYVWIVPYTFAAVRNWSRLVDVAIMSGAELTDDVRYPEVRLGEVSSEETLVVVGFGGKILRVAFCRALGRGLMRCPNRSQMPTYGSSGSPVLDAMGRLVGVVFALNIFEPSLIYFTPWKEADRVLREVSPYPKELK